MERTLSIIKPDGVSRGLIGEVVGMLEQSKLNTTFSRTRDMNASN